MRLGPFNWKHPRQHSPYVLRLDADDLAGLTGREPKLSRIPPAHWRNVYESADPAHINAERAIELGCEELAPGIWRWPVRHVSREMAEQRGRRLQAWVNGREGRPVVQWLRADKFEGEGP